MNRSISPSRILLVGVPSSSFWWYLTKLVYGTDFPFPIEIMLPLAGAIMLGWVVAQRPYYLAFMAIVTILCLSQFVYSGPRVAFLFLYAVGLEFLLWGIGGREKGARKNFPSLRLAVLYSGAFLIAAFIVKYHDPTGSYQLIRDHLDGSVPRYIISAEIPLFTLPNVIVPNALGGLPRSAYPPDLSLYTLLFRCLPPIWAIIVLELIVRSAAFIGMAYFLTVLLSALRLSDGAEHLVIVPGVSLAFALLPFWPGGSLVVAGIPLLVAATYKIVMQTSRSFDYIIILGFPFASQISQGGWAVLLLLLGLYGLSLAYRAGRSRRCLLIFAYVAFAYLIVDWGRIYAVLFRAGYVSHRSSFSPDWYALWHKDNLVDIFSGLWIRALTHGRMYARSLIGPLSYMPLLGIAIAAFVDQVRVILSRKTFQASTASKSGRRPDAAVAPLVYLCAAIIFVSALSCVLQLSPSVRFQLNLPLSIVQTIDFSRIDWLLPPMIYFGIAMSAAILAQIWPFRLPSARFRSRAVVLFIGVHVANSMFHKEIVPSGRILTFEEFYSPVIFEKIKNHIDTPQSDYKVISVGLYPGIALYHGFHTADGYFPDYPLDYKLRFRKLIQFELELSEMGRLFYDGWGSKCFVISHEAFPNWIPRGYAYFPGAGIPKKELSDLRLNPAAYRDLGIAFVLSSVPILNFESIMLAEDGVFTDSESPWTIYLYRVVGALR